MHNEQENCDIEIQCDSSPVGQPMLLIQCSINLMLLFGSEFLNEKMRFLCGICEMMLSSVHFRYCKST